MSQPMRWNVDCGCLVFQYLTLTEAIILSRTNHFWYDISSRRAAYTRMKFPSFQEEFDILEYRHWQKYGRQKLALTPIQLTFNTSRVIQNGITDLELILDESHFDSVDHPTTPLSMNTEEVLWTAISRYQSVVALTITIGSKFGESLTAEMQWRCVNCLITHFAHKLVSFQLNVSSDSIFGFNMAFGLSTTHANVSMPNLLHTRMPVMIGALPQSAEEWWCGRWAPLPPFNPKHGLLELSSLLYCRGTFLSIIFYGDPWETITLSLSRLVDPPAHLIFSYPHRDGRPSSSISRSLGIVLPARFQAPDADVSPEKYWSDHIPIDSHNYQEVDFKVVNTDGQEDERLKDFVPLRRRLAHSVRSLNIEFNEGPPYNRSNIGFRLLMMRDTYSYTVLSPLTDETDYLAAVAESPFIHVTRVRIEGRRLNVDISLMPRVCPSLTQLELSGLGIAFGSDIFRYPHLRHLTTPIPYQPNHTQYSHNYMWNILSHFRQLETLHLILDYSHTHTMNDHCLNLLVLSSPSLTEVILSYDQPSRELWLTERNDQRQCFHRWLIELHLVWQTIQPTHPLPLEQISHTPITSMVDLVPLLATFIRHPSHRLPYLKHRCREYDRSRSTPQPSHLSRLANKISSYLKGWFQSGGREKRQMAGVHGHAVPHPEDIIKQKRVELADHFAREQTRMKLSKTAEFSSNDHMHRLHIEPRVHFRIILQLEKDD